MPNLAVFKTSFVTIVVREDSIVVRSAFDRSQFIIITAEDARNIFGNIEFLHAFMRNVNVKSMVGLVPAENPGDKVTRLGLVFKKHTDKLYQVGYQLGGDSLAVQLDTRSLRSLGHACRIFSENSASDYHDDYWNVKVEIEETNMILTAKTCILLLDPPPSPGISFPREYLGEVLQACSAAEELEDHLPGTFQRVSNQMIVNVNREGEVLFRWEDETKVCLIEGKTSFYKKWEQLLFNFWADEDDDILLEFGLDDDDDDDGALS